MKPADYTFRFTPTGDGPPLEVRVRRMLKAALRHYGLRAEWAHQPAIAHAAVSPLPAGRRSGVGPSDSSPVAGNAGNWHQRAGANDIQQRALSTAGNGKE
jgi:hypothetical protein